MVEIIFMVVMGLLLIASSVKIYFQEALIKLYEKRFKSLEKNDNVMIEYCLGHILQESLEKEDYESADRCDKLLKEYKSKKKAS